MKTVSRQSAISSGLKYYFTGKPCPKGHIAERLVSDYGCRSCKVEAVKKWGKKNPERAALKARESVLRNWDKYIERHKKWRNKNREKVRQTTKNYALQNPEKVKQMVKDWGIRNPDKRRISNLNRIARKNSAEGKFEKKDIQSLYLSQDGKCASCFEELIQYHIDHIMPLVLGGSNWPSNLQLLCVKCNCSKGAKHPEEWKEYLQKQNMRVNCAVVENY
jgi:5-methylcytosine-specific restriction endonuclease McrA